MPNQFCWCSPLICDLTAKVSVCRCSTAWKRVNEPLAYADCIVQYPNTPYCSTKMKHNIIYIVLYWHLCRNPFVWINKCEFGRQSSNMHYYWISPKKIPISIILSSSTHTQLHSHLFLDCFWAIPSLLHDCLTLGFATNCHHWTIEIWIVFEISHRDSYSNSYSFMLCSRTIIINVFFICIFLVFFRVYVYMYIYIYLNSDILLP